MMAYFCYGSVQREKEIVLKLQSLCFDVKVNSELRLKFPNATKNKDHFYPVKSPSYLFCTGTKEQPDCIYDRSDGYKILLGNVVQ